MPKRILCVLECFALFARMETLWREIEKEKGKYDFSDNDGLFAA